MSRRLRVSPVDPAVYSTVVCCPQCQWRALVGSIPAGWHALGNHLRFVHGDVSAAQWADQNGYQRAYYQRESSKNSR